MSQRSKAVELLSEYFEKKGDILTPKQYKVEKDTPIRLEAVKRTFGTWSRMEKIVRAFDARNKNRPEPVTNAREIIAEQNRLAAEHEEMIRAIGEDVEQKVQREAAARAQIETDALNAATPEGARANKVRKGGPESVDAKTIKESVARAVATEHAMFAKTPEGSALGKELLGGVEDQDQKHLATARQNARTERSAMLAATGEGSALAMMEEDDSDGHLTREANARIRNELRPYVAPAKKEEVEEIINGELEKVRPELKDAIERLRKDDDLSIGAAERGDIAYATSGVETIVTEADMSKAVPTHQPADDNLTEQSDEDLKKAGVTAPAPAEKPATTTANTAGDSKRSVAPTAEENKESVNLEENKENPEAPPADRNPDPKLTTAAAERKTPPAKK